MTTRSRKGLLNIVVSLAALAAITYASAQEAVVHIRADQVVHPISRLLTGACIEDVNHEIYGGLYSQMIFGESFQEPAPPAPVPGFAAYGGNWTVRDGALSGDASDGAKLVSEHPAFSDGTVSVDIRLPDTSGENAGIILRVAEPGTGPDAFVGYEVSLDPVGRTLRLARHRGDYEPIQDVPCRVAPGQWVNLRVTLLGSVIETRVDGKLVLRHDDSDAALGAGAVGLRTWKHSAEFRNLVLMVDGHQEPLAFSEAPAASAVSGMWRPIQRGTAKGSCSLVTDRPFVGSQSQQVTFGSGEGEWGIENQGLNRWGLAIKAGKPYEGYVWARSEKPATLYASLESRDGSRVYAEKPLKLLAGTWQRLALRLTPRTGDPAGRFALKLKEPASVTFGYCFLQPGDWGRFKKLPVRRDVAEALVRQGITVLRYGGSMVNSPEYRWKSMVGPRDLRPPYNGTWYRWSSNGWGIPDFMNFCEAAGFEYIPDFNVNEKPQDMADFIEYATGPAASEWGGRRVADGHPAPYRLKYIELGNEERVDGSYAGRFEALAKAIWAKDPKIVLIVGDFLYRRHIHDPFSFEGAESRITTLAAQQRILKLAKENAREVWFDVHVGTERPIPFNEELDGMFSFADALDSIANGAKHSVVVFEYNANNHAMKRALANALATHSIMRDGRLPIVTSANGLQPDGQNDNGWDQGLLFLNPSHVWLQPPGYGTQLYSRNYLPQLVKCDAEGANGRLDVVAARSEDGKQLVIEAVNPGDNPVPARIEVTGTAPRKLWAHLTQLSGPLEAVNTAEATDACIPVESDLPPSAEDGKLSYTFPPRSITVLRFK